VHEEHFTPNHKLAGRYKLFNDALLRATVLERLRLQCVERGLCPVDLTVRLGLIYGHATKSKPALLKDKFRESGWALFDDEWLFGHPKKMAGGSYENSTAAVVAKLLLRPRRDGNYEGCAVHSGAEAIKVNGAQILEILEKCYGDLDQHSPKSEVGMLANFARNLPPDKQMALIACSM